ncbi:hypothetical protein AGMMS49525_09060 [Bacteroidia bacterium]|nr:hypothetical protein AGMMS49525_09060 [Bacteroidia bacterium]
MANEYKNIGVVVAEDEAKARELALQKFPHLKDKNFTLRQDEDTLDTWFSSWLWPISVFDGINEPHNKEIEYYYPTNDLVTAPEIIFFWVARMIMSGYEYRQKPCFKNVYFTGIVRDKLGRKMSKSLGNSPDPIELITKYGADGVRMGMLLSSPAGNDLPFDESLCEQGRNFCNKIWNAFRLVKGWELPPQPPSGGLRTPTPLRGAEGASKIAVEWFENKLAQSIESINDQFDKYRISEALMEVYKLFWDEFSSWYLEMVKPAYQQPIDRTTYEATLGFFDALLRLLHPFMPFITEELWHALAERKDGDSIMISPTPPSPPSGGESVAILRGASDSPPEGGLGGAFKEIISNIRAIRLQKNIPFKESLELQVLGEYDTTYNPVIIKMANLSAITKVSEKTSDAVSFLVKTTEFAIPLGNTLNVEEELEHLQKELTHHQGFLQSVLAKLGNEAFVAKAPAQVLDLERKKQADAESKIKSIEEAMAAYRCKK